MTDRLVDGYEPRFDIDYQFGKQGELFVQDIIKALGTERVEVKHDAVFAATGNVYVEWRCQYGHIWRKSGIAATQAEYWVFVLHDEISCLVVRTHELRLAVRELYRDPQRRRACPRGSHPTEGVVVPVAWLLQHGTRIGDAA